MGSGKMGHCYIGKIFLDKKSNKWDFSLANLQHSNIPWPRPDLECLNSMASAYEILQQQEDLPGKSRQGGPLFHMRGSILDLNKSL
jgi:hypothetical protein